MSGRERVGRSPQRNSSSGSSIAVINWAHIDMAGKAWSDKAASTYDKGATGYGVRLLDQYVADAIER